MKPHSLPSFNHASLVTYRFLLQLRLGASSMTSLSLSLSSRDVTPLLSLAARWLSACAVRYRSLQHGDMKALPSSSPLDDVTCYFIYCYSTYSTRIFIMGQIRYKGSRKVNLPLRLSKQHYSRYLSKTKFTIYLHEYLYLISSWDAYYLLFYWARYFKLFGLNPNRCKHVT